jgi:hypothetical protein
MPINLKYHLDWDNEANVYHASCENIPIRVTCNSAIVAMSKIQSLTTLKVIDDSNGPVKSQLSEDEAQDASLIQLSEFTLSLVASLCDCQRDSATMTEEAKDIGEAYKRIQMETQSNPSTVLQIIGQIGFVLDLLKYEPDNLSIILESYDNTTGDEEH